MVKLLKMFVRAGIMHRVSGPANRDGQACLQLNPGRGWDDQSNSWDQMAKLIGENAVRISQALH
jgi:hypothetical protein